MEQDERGAEEIAELRGIDAESEGEKAISRTRCFRKNEISLLFFKITEFLILFQPFLYLSRLR